ncbi:MAG: hypothetical protein LH481_17765 [Burkholderiales bacterium]|nr:hypothetical protein [Burkholderiales bacterium]
MKQACRKSFPVLMALGAVSVAGFANAAGTPAPAPLPVPTPRTAAPAGPATATLPTAGNTPVVSGVEAKPGNIISIIVPTITLVDDPKLAVQIIGSGKLCQYHLVVINTDTNKESYFPQTSKFPVLVHANLPLDQYAHGNYKVAAMAYGTDKSSGQACLGGGEYTTFKISRKKVTISGDFPKITDVTIKPGKSTAANTYRADESLTYSVLGSVDNLDPKNADKRCGWSLLLTDANGQVTQLGNGTFFAMQNTASLAAFKPGSYTLTAKTTVGDDNLAKMSCLGVATKNITIAAIPGQIKGLKLEARGFHGDGSAFAKALDNGVIDFLSPFTSLINAFVADNGILRITPVIDGPQCAFRVTRTINGGAKTNSIPQIHKPGVSDKQPAQIYSADETNVQITIDAGETEKLLGACEGSITKTITVRDNPKLLPVTM